MSRIGKKPITFDATTTIAVKDGVISISGKKGTQDVPFDPKFVTVKAEASQVQVDRLSDEKTYRARHGLYRSLIANGIQGVEQGFSKRMEIKGVGYRGSVSGNSLDLALGFSHPVKYEIPQGIEIKFDDKSQVLFTISGINKELVGSVAAKIRSFRKPEPYKGKGIRYEDEHITLKAGKSASK